MHYGDMQGAGDMLFVPSGWHHSVCNEADTLSINHNWFNAHNVHWAVELLRSERQEAIAAIEDCRCGSRLRAMVELLMHGPLHRHQRLLEANKRLHSKVCRSK